MASVIEHIDQINESANLYYRINVHPSSKGRWMESVSCVVLDVARVMADYCVMGIEPPRWLKDRYRVAKTYERRVYKSYDLRS